MKCPNCGLQHATKKPERLAEQVGWLGCDNIEEIAGKIAKGAHFQPIDMSTTLFLTASFSTDYKYPLHPWRVSKLLDERSDGHDTFPTKIAALKYIVIMYADEEYINPNIRIVEII